MLDLKRFSIDYPKPKYVLSERKENTSKSQLNLTNLVKQNQSNVSTVNWEFLCKLADRL